MRLQKGNKMNIDDLYNSRYEKFKFDGVDEYIEDLIDEEVSSRDIRSLEELYIFMDILELKLKDKISLKIGKFKVSRGRKEF